MVFRAFHFVPPLKQEVSDPQGCQIFFKRAFAHWHGSGIGSLLFRHGEPARQRKLEHGTFLSNNYFSKTRKISVFPGVERVLV